MIFKNQPVNHSLQADGKNVLLAPLLERIQGTGVDFTGQIVTYFSEIDQGFVYVGKDPIPHDSIIVANEIGANNTVRFKIKSAEQRFGSNLQTKQLKPMTSLVGAVYEKNKSINEPFQVNNTQDRDMLDMAHRALPVTESQTVREIDLITKPRDMQQKIHQEKVMEAAKNPPIQVKNPEVKDTMKNQIGGGDMAAGQVKDNEDSNVSVKILSFLFSPMIAIFISSFYLVQPLYLLRDIKPQIFIHFSRFQERLDGRNGKRTKERTI